MAKTKSKKTLLLKQPKREAGISTNEPCGRFNMRIGHTVYRVGVHFSGTNTETARDKILRLVRAETKNGKAAINQ